MIYNNFFSIHWFKDEYSFLSNFLPCTIHYNGLPFKSVEHAYQAEKSTDLRERMTIQSCSTPGRAKRAGRSLTLRPDWEDVKLQVMEDLLNIKFSIPNLARKLRATSPKAIAESNYWHDNFWGNCLCPKCSAITGQNHLGKLLMKIRDESIEASR